MSAATTPLKHVEPFVVTGGLKGRLSELSLPDVLQYLRATRTTGILTLVSGGARKALYLKDGRIVFASSNLPNDRLGEILIREGKITVEEYEASIRSLSGGKRQGRVLVEMGALSPKDLWEGVQFQIREIVYSLFQWEDGQFHFEESTLPEKERITVELDIVDLIIAGIRRVESSGRIQGRYPSADMVLEPVAEASSSVLEPYEQHVLRLVDGERSTMEVSRESEIGDNESLKVLYSLQASGLIRVKGKKVRLLDQDFVPEDTLYGVVNSFNQMYGYVFRYMVREVGPIAENVLEKYVGTLRDARKAVFAGVKLQKDGTLDASLIERNLNHIAEAERRGLLVDALNELLYAELLAVKRTLGTEHEAKIVRAFRDR
jgi:hypothetical protein